MYKLNIYTRIDNPIMSTTSSNSVSIAFFCHVLVRRCSEMESPQMGCKLCPTGWLAELQESSTTMNGYSLGNLHAALSGVE